MLFRDGVTERAKIEEVARTFAARGARVRLLDRLHAKLYFNEREAIVTSMNLVAASRDSWEIAMCLTRERDLEAFNDVQKAARELHDRAQGWDAGMRPTADVVRAIDPVRKRATRSPTPTGFCIRCGESIPRDPDRPFCASDYAKWAGRRL